MVYDNVKGTITGLATDIGEIPCAILGFDVCNLYVYVRLR